MDIFDLTNTPIWGKKAVELFLQNGNVLWLMSVQKSFEAPYTRDLFSASLLIPQGMTKFLAKVDFFSRQDKLSRNLSSVGKHCFKVLDDV